MTGPAVQPGAEKGWCLNCNEWGDPDPRRAHPASECPWRPVPPGGEELRQALAEHRLTTPRQCLCGTRQDGEWSDTWHAEHVLALPEMRDALAAQEKLRRVEELSRIVPTGCIGAADLRRALGGDS